MSQKVKQSKPKLKDCPDCNGKDTVVRTTFERVSDRMMWFKEKCSVCKYRKSGWVY